MNRRTERGDDSHIQVPPNFVCGCIKIVEMEYHTHIIQYNTDFDLKINSGPPYKANYV